jgi:hypothetical protein
MLTLISMSCSQDLLNEGSFEELPDSESESVTEEVGEDDDDSSLPEGETPADGNTPSSSTHPLRGKFMSLCPPTPRKKSRRTMLKPELPCLPPQSVGAKPLRKGRVRRRRWLQPWCRLS